MNKKYLIYCHTSPSGKSYIGQTNNYKRRCKEHKQLKNNSVSFARAIKKYGWDNFEHKILEENLSIDESNFKEEYYIKEMNTIFPFGYNLTTGGLNRSVSEETKLKISVARKGKSMTGLAAKGMPAHNLGKPATGLNAKGVAKTGLKAKGMPATGLKSKGMPNVGKNAKGSIQPIIQCPICLKEGGKSLMKRYHFDNCKYKLKEH